MINPGVQLGPYKILAKLGAGGMGEIYRAKDTRLGREVAIKVLPPHLAQDTESLARFEREVKALAALSHSNILTIYDFNKDQDISFAVTELLQGETLRNSIDSKGMIWTKAVEIAISIANGLAAAHSKGIIHRDLKPENIFLTSEGIIKILDFGLARIEHPSLIQQASASITKKFAKDLSISEIDDFETNNKTAQLEADILDQQTIEIEQNLTSGSSLTQDGVIIGTVPYMSPEQIQGEFIDPRSDIFSFGCLLYEMLDGKSPFERDTIRATLSAIIREKTPEFYNPDKKIPDKLKHLIFRCLSKERNQRFASASELSKALKEILGSINAQTKLASSLAVLPFTNLSADPEVEYLSDGITESIINSLAQLPQLKVMARSTVFRYKGRDIYPEIVAKDLNVNAVVTGSVLHRGDALRIQAELVNVADGTQLWGDLYNRKMSDVFAMQEEIARQISDKLRMKLTGQESQRLAKRYTTNTEAYQLYLKGRYYWNKRTNESFNQAIEYFNRAIEADPSYAMAYAGLADSYNLLNTYNVLPSKEVGPKAKAAANKALEIDDTLAEAHTSLAYALLYWDWDWDRTEKEFQQSLALNPNYPTTHHWYGWFLINRGRLEEASKAMMAALELDPLSLIINTEAGLPLFYARDYQQAKIYFQKSIEMDPNFVWSYSMLGKTYHMLGLHNEAITALERTVTLYNSSYTLAQLGFVYAEAGKTIAAQEILARLNKELTQKWVSPFDMSIIYTGLGEIDSAFKWLEKAYQARCPWMARLKIDPIFDKLRTDTRFNHLLKCIGLEK